MSEAVFVFLTLGCLSAGFVALAIFLGFRLTPEDTRKPLRRWFILWGVRGWGAPVLLWAIMNVGISWTLQPFMPAVQAAKNRGGDWAPEFVYVLALGLFVISSYWCAVTLGWFLTSLSAAADKEARKDFKALCITCVMAFIVPAGIILVLGGWPTLGVAATAMLAPMAGYAPGILQPKKIPPMYARAVARMKFGKYSEAEWEIIRELEKSEDDYEGWMMLAELYANHFRDLTEAERTVMEICAQPTTTLSQISVALHRLADWQLKLGQDPVAARRALQMVCNRLPGTHLARMAQLRINQLPLTREDLREQQSAKPIPLPALGDKLDEPPAPLDAQSARRKAAQDANACVERLKQDPNNIAARERLARIFTEDLNQPDLGLEQLTLLLNMPDQPELKRADWLGLVAAWHIKFKHDLMTGRKFLERLLHEFPQSPQAFAARRRLELLERELRNQSHQSDRSQEPADGRD